MLCAATVKSRRAGALSAASVRDARCIALQARPPLPEPAQAPGASGLLATASSLFTTLTGVPSMGGSLSHGGTSSSLQHHTLTVGGSQDFGDEAALAQEESLDPSAFPQGPSPLLLAPCTCMHNFASRSHRVCCAVVLICEQIEARFRFSDPTQAVQRRNPVLEPACIDEGNACPTPPGRAAEQTGGAGIHSRSSNYSASSRLPRVCGLPPSRPTPACIIFLPCICCPNRCSTPLACDRPRVSSPCATHGRVNAVAHAGGEAVMTQLASTLSASDCRELLLFVMECAQRIALEPRPEVRTGGVRLLFDIMTRHGVALAGEEGLVWDMAFPLLMEVAKNAQLSDEAHRAAAAGTRPRSAQVRPVPRTLHGVSASPARAPRAATYLSHTATSHNPLMAAMC